MADPFNWKPDAVAEFLCSPSREVTEEPEALAAKIRDERFNGKRLLTFGVLLSDRQLQEHLGLAKAWQQIELAQAIRELRQESPAFETWQARQAGGPPSRANVHAQTNGETTDSLANGTQPANPKATSLGVRQNGTAPATAANDQSSDPTFTGAPVRSNHSNESPVAPSPSTHTVKTVDEPKQGDVDDRPAKRRRMAPTNVSTEPISSVPIHLRAEEDYLSEGFIAEAKMADSKVLESSSPYSYLGEGYLPLDDILSTSAVLSTKIIDDASGGFSLQLPNRLPPGRRIVVNRAMKRLIRENNGKANRIDAGYEVSSRHASIGLNDLPDDYDEETWREYEAELDEREALLALKLTAEEVTQLLDQAAATVTADWKVAKLPKWQNRAFKIWNAASRRGSRKYDIEKATAFIAHLEARLQQQRRDILKSEWTKPEDVIRQAGVCELTIEEKCYQNWVINLLTSNIRPPKPDGELRRRAVRKPREELAAGEEILMSSDEEDDFIVDDMEEVADQLRTEVEFAFNRPKQEPKEPPEIMNLVTPIRGPKFIDLTLSPVDAVHSAELAAFRQHDSKRLDAGEIIIATPEMVENAKGMHPKDASKKGKNELLMSLLWKLGHQPRMNVFAKASEASPGTIWQDTVDACVAQFSESDPEMEEQAKNGELQPETLQTAFDMAKIFLMYWRGHWNPPVKVVPTIKKRLPAAWKDTRTRNAFKIFLSLLSQAAPHFPQDAQIYRREPLLEDLGGDDDFADEPANDETPSRRRRAQVEIVQDKDALDIREREARRNEELAARAQKLRSQLAFSGSVSADKTQHIINEGKQEHQGLLYVNDETSKRIKPHQIDGVRFIWNSIMQDVKERQGCLLAHTMGLGKSMQVITFLVALREAANSADPTIREQVPADMRENRTIITCPSGLVDNWMDELLTWSPLNSLTPLRKVDSTLSRADRVDAVEQWAEGGGILLVGFEMLKQLFGMDEDIAELLVTKATAVIADEAHKLKNSQSQIHAVCSRFETKSRIALTGSPLANNVEEYYHMINWIAPNYLGPLQEFREIYSKDIEAGLYHDSLGFEKRRAIKMLQVLKETVAPKVHRATIAALKDDLPNKHEFVISVAPTPRQRKLYDECIGAIQSTYSKDMKQGQLFKVLGVLSLVCNHPKCLYTKTQAASQTLKARPADFDLEGGSGGSLTETVMKIVTRAMRGLDADDPGLSAKVGLLIKVLDDARAAGDKVLVFSTSIPTLQFLQHILIQQKRSIAFLDGSTKIANRQSMVKNFNSGHQEVYLISTTAGGVGLNIHGANRVVLFDFKWNPMDEQQAIGRAYRIGQKKVVFVYRFVVAGTFEEDLYNKAVFKTQLASRVVDKKNPISWSKRGGRLIHEVNDAPQQDLTSFVGKDRILDNIINEHGDVVRSIMSTDTFEEEDHTAVLTAEELQETDRLVQMHRLRTTDPDAWQREMDRQRAADMIAARDFQLPAPMPASMPGDSMQTHPSINSATNGLVDMNGTKPLPSTQSVYQAPASSVAQSMDGASDYPLIRHRTTGGVFSVRQTHGGPKVSFHGGPETYSGVPAPPPITGTNTYIGNRPISRPQPAPPATPAKPSPFQMKPLQAKTEFENAFKFRLSKVKPMWEQTCAVDSRHVADIVSEVDQLRRDKALGFVPDDAHWQCLRKHSMNDRFTAAAALRRFTPQWLAFAKDSDISARVATLDEMSTAEFSRYLKGTGNSVDPTNLNNIQRAGNFSPVGSPHANDDMKAMREAADKRRRRSTLPPWAQSALTSNQQ